MYHQIVIPVALIGIGVMLLIRRALKKRRDAKDREFCTEICVANRMLSCAKKPSVCMLHPRGKESDRRDQR